MTTETKPRTDEASGIADEIHDSFHVGCPDHVRPGCIAFIKRKLERHAQSDRERIEEARRALEEVLEILPSGGFRDDVIRRAEQTLAKLNGGA